MVKFQADVASNPLLSPIYTLTVFLVVYIFVQQQKQLII